MPNEQASSAVYRLRREDEECRAWSKTVPARRLAGAPSVG